MCNHAIIFNMTTEISHAYLANLIEIKPDELSQQTEVVLPLKIVSYLENLTTSHRNTDEVWFFVLQRDGAEGTSTQLIEIASGRPYSTYADVEETYQRLAGFVSKGYRVVADFHNHPESGFEDYRQAGFPENWAITPSYADLSDTDIRPMIIDRLHQQPYPRIIGGFSTMENRVIFNAFAMVKPLYTSHDITAFKTGDTKVGPRGSEPQFLLDNIFLEGEYTDPKKILKLGLIKLLPLVSVADNGVRIEQQNDLETA